jgi:Flp pilus assembly protein TadG
LGHFTNFIVCSLRPKSQIYEAMMAQDWVGSLLSAIARCSHDTCGASAMVVAIAVPGLIGFGALGAETGLWYTIKLRNQSAADAAAISAAYELIAGRANVTEDVTRAASEAAAQNGYTGITPAVVHPYSDGIVSNGVAVTLQQTQGASLASPFLPGVTIASKAVAVIKVLDNPCILARAVDVVSSSSLNVPNCSVAANSTSTSAIDLQDGTGSIAAATLVTRGEISFAGNPIDPSAPPSQFILSSRPMIGAPAITDPYASTLTHAFLTSGMPQTCAAGPPYAANSQICGGLSVDGATVDLMPGTYWITDGDLTLQSSAGLKCSTCDGANGTGVTIILTTGKAGIVGNVQIPSGTTVTLQAPDSGRFAGLLFVQDALATSSGSSALEAGANIHVTGLLYFPNTTVSFRGNPSATCTVLIANRVVIVGNSNLTTSRCRRAGLTKLPRVRTVALAE